MAVILLVLYSCLVGCAVLFEDKFIYFPSKYPDGYWHVAESRDPRAPRIEDVWLTAADGVRVHGWYCQPAAARVSDGESLTTERPVVLFFHGNAGNLSHRIDTMALLTSAGSDVFIIDYHGYGRSEGAPTEKTLYYDSQAAWDYLTSERGIAARRIVIYGESIGAAVAIELAARVQPAGLITEAAFTSIPDMAAVAMPFIPRFAVSTQFNSIDRIPNVTCPKFIAHSPTDEMIPFEQGQRLFDAAKEPKTFYKVEGASHNDMHIVGGEAYHKALRDFIDKCVHEPEE